MRGISGRGQVLAEDHLLELLVAQPEHRLDIRRLLLLGLGVVLAHTVLGMLVVSRTIAISSRRTFRRRMVIVSNPSPGAMAACGLRPPTHRS